MYALLTNALRHLDRRPGRRLHRAGRFRRDRIVISAEIDSLTPFGTRAIRSRERRAVRRMVKILSGSPDASGDGTIRIDLIRTLEGINPSANERAFHAADLAKSWRSFGWSRAGGHDRQRRSGASCLSALSGVGCYIAEIN